jgi:hypothetical protein
MRHGSAGRLRARPSGGEAAHIRSDFIAPHHVRVAKPVSALRQEGSERQAVPGLRVSVPVLGAAS